MCSELPSDSSSWLGAVRKEFFNLKSKIIKAFENSKNRLSYNDSKPEHVTDCFYYKTGE
jgi:hypothetical protein